MLDYYLFGQQINYASSDSEELTPIAYILKMFNKYNEIIMSNIAFTRFNPSRPLVQVLLYSIHRVGNESIISDIAFNSYLKEKKLRFRKIL